MNVFFSWISFTLLKNNNTLSFYFFWYKKNILRIWQDFNIYFQLSFAIYSLFSIHKSHLHIFSSVLNRMKFTYSVLTKKFQYINTLIKKIKFIPVPTVSPSELVFCISRSVTYSVCLRNIPQQKQYNPQLPPPLIPI